MRQPRYSIIPAAAVTDRRLEPRDLQVLCLLGRHTDDNGWCRRSQVKMAREIACARSTLQLSLDRLVDAGWLETRSEQRIDGGDAASSYRVIIDRPEAPEIHADSGDEDAAEGGADLSAGVPTYRQGVPIHASAPIRTTPVERRERETHARAPDEIAPEVRELAKQWKTGAADRLADATRAWDRLSEAQRREAVGQVDEYRRYLDSNKRSRWPALQTYLAHRLWELIPSEPDTPPPSVPERPRLALLARAWWWEFHRRAAAGDHAGIRLMLSLAASGLGISVSIAPTSEQEAELVQVGVGFPEFDAWRRHYEAAGFRFPRIDAAQFVWMPSLWPPDSTADAGLAWERS